MTDDYRPEGLGSAGSRLWDRITADYELTADMERVLEDACFEADVITRLRVAVAEGELTTRGSMGQTVEAAELSALRQHVTVLRQLLAQLKLPTPPSEAEDTTPEGQKMTRSESGRKAAMTRWHPEVVA